MAATEILASDSTAASSSDQTVASGAIVTLLVRGPGSLVVKQKASDGTYIGIGQLVGTDDALRSQQLSGPIVYAVFRSAGQTAACDVDTGA